MQKDGLERERSLLPLTLTRVSSRAELTISLCEDITACGESTIDVNTCVRSRAVDAVAVCK